MEKMMKKAYVLSIMCVLLFSLSGCMIFGPLLRKMNIIKRPDAMPVINIQGTVNAVDLIEDESISIDSVSDPSNLPYKIIVGDIIGINQDEYGYTYVYIGKNGDTSHSKVQCFFDKQNKDDFKDWKIGITVDVIGKVLNRVQLRDEKGEPYTIVYVGECIKIFPHKE